MNRLCPTCMDPLTKNHSPGDEFVYYEPHDWRTVAFCSEDCRDEYKENENERTRP